VAKDRYVSTLYNCCEEKKRREKEEERQKETERRESRFLPYRTPYTPYTVST
jgi:hypothetical protein